ncbi:CopD family protein [Luteibaculum oceani]|uniref:Protoporphyrinogen IX oxidase n=1 Tax=Luteibaculum oceani TaxID=1294296 RepID=A0A5C6V294_9FLAO|nr:CopD family protein [Luteibaculum oceani]TXC78950.1 CopD family protein [Luteibaculum oceani]
MDFTAFKALHLVFMVSWFAGLFYMPRLFVYHAEASKKDNPERDILCNQFKIMQRRLWYIITWPACILTLVFGISMLVANPAYLQLAWMHLKLAFVFGLFLYHLSCGRYFRKFQKDIIPGSSLLFRMWNEIATILLIAIVFVVVYKDLFNWIWGVAGILGVAVLLTLSIMAYKKKRQKKESENSDS